MLKADKKIRPFLKWAGGKYQLLPKLLPHMSDADCLLEPFVGAGAVFLNTNYRRYHLNDINADLIHVYQTLKRSGQDFIDHVKSLFKPRYNNAKRYYACRDKFNNLEANDEKAALFIYLNRHGYNGLCRYNLKGLFNVPFGSYTNPQLPEDSMFLFYEKAQRSKFTCHHFSKIMKKVSKSTIIYCDPPYVPLTKTAYFTRYSAHSFATEEHQELAECAQRLHREGSKIILSNHDTPITRQLYRNAKLLSIDVPRYISCHAHRRVSARELIAIYSHTT